MSVKHSCLHGINALIVLPLVLIGGAFSAAGSQTAVDSRIRLNSVGFLPGFPKRATVAADFTRFWLYEAPNGTTPVYSEGTVSEPVKNTDTNEDGLRVADFSGFDKPGRYYMLTNNSKLGKSIEFTIGEKVFEEPFRAAMLGFYLWRCGTAVSASYNGKSYKHDACHMSDARVCHDSAGKTICVGGTGGTRGAAGGWHDAGDYNKYVVNSGVTVGLLLKAWEHFGNALGAVDIFTPKSGNIPKYLTEVKWNIDWVAKMQYGDGEVSHKLSALGFCGMVMPEKETSDRYFARWSTSATGSFVGMLAQASRLYKPYDAAFANSCLVGAKRSYDLLKGSPFVREIQAPFVTGSYGSSAGEDKNKRLWAAAEMWEATGDQEYLTYLENNLNATHIQAVTEWGGVQNLASLTYLASQKPGRRQSLVDSLRAQLLAVADDIVNTVNSNVYGRALDTNYWWGVNGAVASTAYTLNAAYTLTGEKKYRHAVQDAVSHLFGRNYFSRSFVTDVGVNPPQNPHDRRSAADKKPWPGYLVGGPNNSSLNDIKFSDGQKRTCATQGICYFDDVEDYARNEIAINWNAPLVYALAGLIGGNASGAVRGAQTTVSTRRVKITRVVIKNGKTPADIPVGAKIYSLDGKLIARRKSADAKLPVIRKNGVLLIMNDELK